MGILKKIGNIFDRKKKTKTEEVIEPVATKPRYPCPFYGFFCGVFSGILMDQDGNQCALITDSHSPCRMENPDWNECRCHTEDAEKILDVFREQYKVGAHEFWPKDQSQWEGITFSEWYSYVMSDKCPRATPSASTR
jgi:hypothetical protein